MDQPQQQQGNFVINLNYRRNTNPKAPPITGRISAPESPEAEMSFSAFEQTDKDGARYWIGPVDAHQNMRQALTNRQQPNTHFIAIRENGFKVFAQLPDGKPNPAFAKLSEAEQKHENSKPSFWATWTRTDAEPQIRASAWEREATRYGPWASGNTQYPLSKEDAAALKAGRPATAELNAPEPAQAPRRTKATAGARERA